MGHRHVTRRHQRTYCRPNNGETILSKKGVELFGDRSKVAAIKELRQIHNMETYTPMDPKHLTWDLKNKALSALFFLTEKCNGDIKAQKVSRGDKQRTFDGYIKSNISLPTVSTNDVIITTAIDAHKGEQCYHYGHT